MIKIIDINNWYRKEHFRFFSTFDEPYFGIVTEVDCTKAYKNSKKHSYSFFAYYLHKSLIAANKIEEFKYRIKEGNVIFYDVIHASPTIGRNDGSFDFSVIPFTADFKKFSLAIKKETELVKNSRGLRLTEDMIRDDLIHYSSVPWIKFSGVTHPRNFKSTDSVPKISFGKIFDSNKKLMLPVSINVHHGLADGYHVAEFLEQFQNLLNEK